jgi:hypothetical protein
VQPFKIKVTRFGKQKLGAEMGQAFLAMIFFASLLLVGVPTLIFEKVEIATLFKLNFGDVLYPLLIPLGVFVGRYITYFGQTGELIFTEQGITVKDGDKEAFKAWSAHKIYIHLDGFINQKVNGKTREGNRNYVEIATSTGTEKHFFQIFGKKQLDYLMEQLKPLEEDRLLKMASHVTGC